MSLNLLWLFWLAILGSFIYFTLKRKLPQGNTAPLALLWLTMMAPALTWVGWVWLRGDRPPLEVVLLTLVVSTLLYWWLLFWGRSPRVSERSSEDRSLDPNPSSERSSDRPPSILRLPTLQDMPRPLTNEEEARLRQCFSWADFALQKLEYRFQAVVCQGNLRADPAVAYAQIQDRVQSQFGDRFLLILQEDGRGKPFFALVPNPQAQEAKPSQPLSRPAIALGLLGLTLMTTTFAGVQFQGIQPSQWQRSPALLQAGLPYALSLLLILGVHEWGHFWMAQRYRLRTTLPYFIPFPSFLGTFGAFIKIRSPMPTRQVLFDVGIAGPIAGLVMTVPLLLWGLGHSTVIPAPDESSLLSFKALDPKGSLLLLLLSRGLLGDTLTQASALQLHPVAIAGYLGLVVTAMNLMPVGQLDGGHVVHAMFGQRVGAMIGQIARLLMLALALVRREFLLWALLLLFIPAVDEPALNDVSELDNRRDALGLMAIALLLLIVLPAPAILVRWLL